MKSTQTLSQTYLVLTFSLCAALPAVADLAFETTITGDQAVPANISGAYGTATIILNDEGTDAAFTVIFAGLEAPQTAAHFRNAEPGETGPIVFDLGVGSPLAGVWNLTAQQATELVAGRIYVNIQTELFPVGEIRGNFHLTQVAAEPATWGGIKLLYR